jgi:hypothetical protein
MSRWPWPRSRSTQHRGRSRGALRRSRSRQPATEPHRASPPRSRAPAHGHRHEGPPFLPVRQGPHVAELNAVPASAELSPSDNFTFTETNQGRIKKAPAKFVRGGDRNASLPPARSRSSEHQIRRGRGRLARLLADADGRGHGPRQQDHDPVAGRAARVCTPFGDRACGPAHDSIVTGHHRRWRGVSEIVADEALAVRT